MRHSTWLAPMIVLALQACGDDRRLVPESETVPASSAALAAQFDPLVCTLGDECDRWGEPVTEPAVEASECEPLDDEPQPIAWQASIESVRCPFGRCATLDVQLAAEPAGTLLAMSRVELPSTPVRMQEAGLSFTRYEADGSRAWNQLWDFAIPPPGVEVWRNARLLTEPSGDPVLVTARAVLPGDRAQPLSTAKIRGRKEPKLHVSNVKTPALRAQRIAIGPSDSLLVASAYLTGESDEDPTQRAVLTFHDRRGQVLWNRPWPASSGWTEIVSVHFDSAGQITVLVWASEGPERGSTVLRLDRNGRVIWRRFVGSSFAQSSLDREGNAYVLSSTWLDDFEARLERIDRLGHATAAWSIAQLGFVPELHRGRDGVWITNRTDVGLGTELWALPFGAGTAAGGACQGQRYLWPGEWDDFENGPIALTESEQSEVYVSNGRLIFKLGGDAP